MLVILSFILSYTAQLCEQDQFSLEHFGIDESALWLRLPLCHSLQDSFSGLM